MHRQKFFRVLYSLSATLWLAVLLAAAFPTLVQAATINVASPSNGQEFSGNTFNMSGTTDPNSTVLIRKNQDVLKSVISDGDGHWQTTVSDLPDGKNDITAEVVKNPGYAYFATVNLSGPSSTLNQIRLSDNAVNPNPGWPVTPTGLTALFMPAPVGTYAYTANPITPGSKPARLDTADPDTPIDVTGFPSGMYVQKGDFNADGTKYYALYVDNTDSDLTTVSRVAVVDVASNTISETIDLDGELGFSVWRSPQGKIFIVGKKITIIDPETDSIIKSYTPDCNGSKAEATTVGFSSSSSFSYYFIACGAGSDRVIKAKLSDDSVVDSWALPYQSSTIVPSLDNKKLYISPVVSVSDDHLREVDIDTGEVLTTIDLSHGSIGFVQPPDGQTLYVATPGYPPTQSGIDLVSTITGEVTTITTSNAVFGVSMNVQSATRANANVSVVLGVKTADSNSLQQTGIAVISAGVVGVILVAILIYTYVDYRRHRKPLVEADPHAGQSYTYRHHIAAVTIPLLRYRIHISLSRSPQGISKF